MKYNIQTILKQEVESNKIAGAQFACYQNGEELIYVSEGVADIEQKRPMSRGTIGRLYSMSKPVIAVMCMILIERKQLSEEDLVATYLPEYAHMTVISDTGEVQPCNTPLTIGHLLHMTAGIVYPDGDQAGKQMEQILTEIQSKAYKKSAYSTREVVRKIADCPLAHEPGATWRYGFCADVLGAIIEVITNQTLGEALQSELFGPLGMVDTGFYVPPEKQCRFAQLYEKKEVETSEGIQYSLSIDKNRHLGITLCLAPPEFESGGAGLVSTLEDYSHFVKMLAAGGIYEGRRYLKKESVKKFSQGMLTKNQKETYNFPQVAGYNYGYLMRQLEDVEAVTGLGSVGEFGWDGWTGPYCSIDVEHEFACLYMVQISGNHDWNTMWKLREEAYRMRNKQILKITEL